VGISRRSESLSEISYSGRISSLKNLPYGGASFFLKSNSPLIILSDHTGLLLASAGYFYRDLDRDWARIAKKNRAKKLSSCVMSPDFAFEVESDLMDRVCDVRSIPSGNDLTMQFDT
jgi:hypothetical protein